MAPVMSVSIVEMISSKVWSCALPIHVEWIMGIPTRKRTVARRI
jgi:hypothetical protein